MGKMADYLQIWKKKNGNYLAVIAGVSRECTTFEDLVYGVLDIFQQKRYEIFLVELGLKGKLVDRAQTETLLQQEREADFTLTQQGILERIVKFQNKIGGITEILNER